MNKFRNKDKLIICLVISAGILSLSLMFGRSYVRIWESLKDLGLSFYYYFCELFGIKCNLIPTVTRVGYYDTINPEIILKFFNFKALGVFFEMGFTSLINGENFVKFFNSVLMFLANFSQILLLILPIILIGLMLIKKYLTTQIKEQNEDSKPLKIYKSMIERVYKPVKNYIIAFKNYLLDHKYFFLIWCVAFAIYFNFITIIIEFFSFYFYFVMSFDFVNIPFQFYKLLIDLIPMFAFVPLIVWIIIGLIIFDKTRRKIGFTILNHNEMKNRGFINERPIVLMLCGSMGSKKTTMITDIALSQEIMLRNKAFEKLLEHDLKFPDFPWINFETKIKQAIEEHKIYNLATAKKWVEEQKEYFDSIPAPGFIYGYDINKYRTEFDNNLYIEEIWNTLTTYCQLYFIYLIQSSLIISNYSIRTDNEMIDMGNFPLWNTDLFKKKSIRSSEAIHSHILDFDSLRLGKKVLENNQLSDSFEFGVINITEIGKERGNSLENMTVKKNDLTANQKNDLFNSWLKMVRHSATVDNYPFVKVISDEQRPESWGADARDLCEIVYVDKVSEPILAMPFFTIEEMVIDSLTSKFSDKYYDFRFERSDNTLIMYLYHKIISSLYNFKKRIYNQFGYNHMILKVEKGTMDEADKVKMCNYYLSFKKIYSKRFSTDCFSDFFTEKALRSEFGLDDLPSFEKEKASFEEMLQENSYFFNDLVRIKNNLEEEKKEDK